MRRPEQEGWQQLPQGQDQLWHGLSQPWAEAKINKKIIKKKLHSRLEVLQPFKTMVPMQASRDRVRVNSLPGWWVQPQCLQKGKGTLPQNRTPVTGVSRQGPGGPPGPAPAQAGPHCCRFVGGKLERTVKHFLLLPEAQWAKKGLFEFIPSIHKFS